MLKSNSFIFILPFVFIALIMQVYKLWGWLSRDGWVQYLMMAEVYILIFITLLFIRSIILLKNTSVKLVTILLIPTFYILFSDDSSSVSGVVNSLWYINLLVSIIASTWLVVLSFGIFWSLKFVKKQKIQRNTILWIIGLIVFSTVIISLIKSTQLSSELILHIWNDNKPRTIWFFLEPVIVLAFSVLSIYFYVRDKKINRLKNEYLLIGVVILSLVFEYMINGFSLLSARTVLYFVGIYCFIRLVKVDKKQNFILTFVFLMLIAIHLYYYSQAPAFFTMSGFIDFLHNAIIESIKMFMAIYIFIFGWNNVKVEKIEFRLIMILVSIVAYTYTTQSRGIGVQFYDIAAITIMLKINAFFLIFLYGFYYFKSQQSTSLSKKEI